MPGSGEHDHSYDVVIAGGGLVGGSLALTLAATSLRVALIESVVPEDAGQPSFDERTLALSHGSCRMLQQVGLWDSVRTAAWPIHRIHVSEQHRFGTTLIDAGEQGLSELGFVIQSRALGQALWQQLRQLPALRICAPARAAATACESGASHRQVTLESSEGQETLHTRLLVVADGSRSALRDALDLESHARDYAQTAIVATLQVSERYAGTTAYERFTQDGPMALLPGAVGCYTVVMAAAASRAAEIQAMSDADFIALVQQNIGSRLGLLNRPGRRLCYPLQLVQAAKLTAERAVLIGNAAHALHPVAGQGFNLGLRDVACLAELLADCHAAGAEDGDCGDPQLLQRYIRWRGADQRRVVTFTDGLIRLFGLSGPGVSQARGLGLALFDLLPGARRELARQTMGLSGRVARLMRGLRL